MSSISSTISHGTTTSTAHHSPLTITAAGYVGTSGRSAVYSGSVATVVNADAIGGNTSRLHGVDLQFGGDGVNPSGGPRSGFDCVKGVNARPIATLQNDESHLL
ncbi:MAG TPA: hypothetical protein VGM42_11985 [Rhodopila sp.]